MFDAFEYSKESDTVRITVESGTRRDIEKLDLQAYVPALKSAGKEISAELAKEAIASVQFETSKGTSAPIYSSQKVHQELQDRLAGTTEVGA